MRNGFVHLPTMGSTLPATGAECLAVSSHLPSCDNRASHECPGEGRVANVASCQCSNIADIADIAHIANIADIADIANTFYAHPARRCRRRVAATAMRVALVCTSRSSSLVSQRLHTSA